jgi:hypothetical protein
MRYLVPLACVLLLSGCVPHQKLQQEQVDAARYRAQLGERESSQQCSEVAMPGTTEHLVCRLGAK